MEQNDKYLRGFINAALDNVLGPGGIHFQCKITRSAAFGESDVGSQDRQANDIVETFYKKSGTAKNYLVSRDMTRRASDRMKMQRLIVDGEFFVRTYHGFNNECGIAAQIIDPDMVDVDLNVSSMPGGNQIRMGVEVDKYFAPVAYWIMTRARNDYQQPGSAPSDYHERVPAAHIRHVFIRERPGQTRGMPWIASAMLSLRMLGMFEMAALVNAKLGASRNVFYEKSAPEGWTPSDAGVNQDGAIPDNLREGEQLELPYGVTAKTLDTRYPDGEIALFSKCMLRGIAVALGSSYMTLTGDLSEANFSSLRAGKNNENAHWASLQQMLIEQDCQPDFEDKLSWALATQSIKLPPGKFDKFNKPEFTGRKWASVNPMQDNAADIMAINNLITSPQRVIRARGDDPDEIIRECRDFRDLARAAGLYIKDDPTLAAEAIKSSMEQDTGKKNID